jgi:hypothetical protein
MKIAAAVLLALTGCSVRADCPAPFALEGTLVVETCKKGTRKCEQASKLVFEYVERHRDDDNVFSIALQSSPWHLYDADMRIIDIDALAETVRTGLEPHHKRLLLLGSWTAAAPEGVQSHAERLSAALNGFPVEGMDGFLWLDKKGRARTTRQAFTGRMGLGPYYARRGDDVMVALAGGWQNGMESFFRAQGDAHGLMRAAAAWDMFMLCPDNALAHYEEAARMKEPDAIAAYNAAVMHLERGGDEHIALAIELLGIAAGLGDQPSAQRLIQLKERESASVSPND